MFFVYLIEQRSKFCYIPYRWSLTISRSIGATKYSYLKCIIHNTLEIGVFSCTDGARNSQRAPVRHVKKTWSVVLLSKRKHILLSQVYSVWQVVKIPTIILNNPVLLLRSSHGLFFPKYCSLKDVCYKVVMPNCTPYPWVTSILLNF